MALTFSFKSLLLRCSPILLLVLLSVSASPPAWPGTDPTNTRRSQYPGPQVSPDIISATAFEGTGISTVVSSSGLLYLNAGQTIFICNSKGQGLTLECDTLWQLSNVNDGFSHLSLGEDGNVYATSGFSGIGGCVYSTTSSPFCMPPYQIVWIPGRIAFGLSPVVTTALLGNSSGFSTPSYYAFNSAISACSAYSQCTLIGLVNSSLAEVFSNSSVLPFTRPLGSACVADDCVYCGNDAAPVSLQTEYALDLGGGCLVGSSVNSTTCGSFVTGVNVFSIETTPGACSDVDLSGDFSSDLPAPYICAIDRTVFALQGGVVSKLGGWRTVLDGQFGAEQLAVGGAINAPRKIFAYTSLTFAALSADDGSVLWSIFVDSLGGGFILDVYDNSYFSVGDTIFSYNAEGVKLWETVPIPGFPPYTSFSIGAFGQLLALGPNILLSLGAPSTLSPTPIPSSGNSPSTSPVPVPPSNNAAGSSSLSTPVVVGISLGAVGWLVAMLLGFLMCIRWRYPTSSPQTKLSLQEVDAVHGEQGFPLTARGETTTQTGFYALGDETSD